MPSYGFLYLLHVSLVNTTILTTVTFVVETLCSRGSDFFAGVGDHDRQRCVTQFWVSPVAYQYLSPSCWHVNVKHDHMLPSIHLNRNNCTNVF